MIPRILALAALGAAVCAQQTKVVPAGMDFVEGPSVSTVPFSATTSGIQMLIEASQVTSGTALITAMNFRPTQQTQTSPAFVKNYVLTAYTTTVTAQAFENSASPYDPNAIINGAAPTVVFNGPISFPATSPLTVTPAPFSIQIPFATPYVYDSTQGNLLLMLESTDLQTTPGTYRVDAVQFRETQITGIVAPIATGCTSNGSSLSQSTAAASLVTGGLIDVQLTSSPPAAFPLALVTLGLSRADADLSPLGLVGCVARSGSLDLSQLVVAFGGGAFPPVQWIIPPDPAFLGVALVSQSLGLSGTGAFTDSVLSNAEALRIGENALPPTITAMYGFHTVTATVDNWFHGVVGQFTPVVQLEGVFP